jgi:hypothetical protein
LLKKGYQERWDFGVSPWGAPILFGMKKDGILRPCIDFRYMNKVIVRIKYRPPIIDGLFDQLREENILSKIDMRFGYHKVMIKYEYICNIAFRTRYEHYEFIVVPF